MFTNFSIISKSISLILLVSCFLLFNSDSFSQQTDKWHDQELETGSDNIWLYAVLGVLAAGTIAYFIFKPSSSKDKPVQKNKDSDNYNYNYTKSDSTKKIEPDSTDIEKSFKPDK